MDAKMCRGLLISRLDLVSNMQTGNKSLFYFPLADCKLQTTLEQLTVRLLHDNFNYIIDSDQSTFILKLVLRDHTLYRKLSNQQQS